MPNFSIENWISLAGMLFTIWLVISNNRKTRNHNSEQTAIQQALMNEWKINRENVDILQNEKIEKVEKSVEKLIDIQRNQANEITMLQKENSTTIELLRKIENSVERLISLPDKLDFIKEMFEEKIQNVKRPYQRQSKWKK